jgi:Na+-transporting methylmalonyl-CoA/oxaloacetate decarboxylase gamma subunit
MDRKTKIIVFCVLTLLGVVMLGYGAFVNSVAVWPQKEEGASATVKSEPALVKEASVGGVTLDESRKIKQTYTGAAPKECAT